MSFFEDASLVLIPSAQKTSKVYSVKPTDGTGDLTFTRSNDTATRVASNGLIEKVRTNLFRYSEQFNNTAAWQYQGSPIISANASVAPDGTTTADLLYPSVNGSVVAAIQSITSASSVEYTQSVYVKASGKNFVALYTFNGTTGTAMWVNLTTGAITNGVGANVSNRFATNVGNGWWRIGFTDIGNGTTTYIHVYPTDAASSNDVTASGTNGILLWGAQLETGVLTSYIATTTAAVSVGPVANVPRLDYLNSSCPRLLLEGQRSNLANWSEQANQYTKVGATIGSNVLASPDGTVNADSIIEDASSGPHAFYNFGLTTFTAAAYTASVFAKKGTRDWVSLSLYDGTTDRQAFFNLATGVAGNVTAGATSTITNFGNGWYRCTITATAAATAGGIAVYAANVNGSATYAGVNGNAAIYAYGWQLELGAYATSYIPTLGAAVTRGADAASKTGISSLIGQTEGTIFAEFQYYDNIAVGSSQYISPLTISNGGYTESVYFEIFNDSLSGVVWAGTLQAAISKSNLTSGTHRAALAYKQNDIAFYLDGVLIGTDTNATISSSLSQLNLGTVGASTNLDQAYTQTQALLFKTRLTNADLAALTA